MRVQVRINRGLDGKFQKLSEQIELYRDNYYRKVATNLAEAMLHHSDTGTYLNNFYAGNSGTADTPSSRGKPRGIPWGANGPEAINRMYNGVAGLRSTVAIFGNSADHANLVEYKHGIAPFGKTANLHGQMMAEAWREAGL